MLQKTQNTVKSLFKAGLSPAGSLRTRAGSFKEPNPSFQIIALLTRNHTLSPNPEPDTEPREPSTQSWGWWLKKSPTQKWHLQSPGRECSQCARTQCSWGWWAEVWAEVWPSILVERVILWMSLDQQDTILIVSELIPYASFESCMFPVVKKKKKKLFLDWMDTNPDIFPAPLPHSRPRLCFWVKISYFGNHLQNTKTDPSPLYKGSRWFPFLWAPRTPGPAAEQPCWGETKLPLVSSPSYYKRSPFPC